MATKNTKSADANTTTRPKRKAAATREYIMGVGTEGEDVGSQTKLTNTVIQNGIKAVRWTFQDDTQREVDPSILPENIQRALAAFGLSTVLNSSFTSTGEDAPTTPDEMVEAFDNRLAIMMQGFWAESKGTSGSSMPLIMEAVIAAIKEMGKEPDVDQIRNELFDADEKLDKEKVAAFKANPLVAAKYAAIKAQRAEERAKKKAKKAEEAGSDSLLALLGGDNEADSDES